MKTLYKKCLQKLESPAVLKRDQLAFMPAALEVQETPPSPLGRAIIWSIALLFVIAVLWASFGHIDVVAVATGKVVPSDRVKVIQPLEKGTVVAIYVKGDQLVNRGDPLVALDTTATAADEKRLANDLQEARMAWLQTEAFRTVLETFHTAPDNPPPDDLALIRETIQKLALTLSEAEALLQSQLLRAERLEYQSQVGSLDGQYNARVGERNQAQALKRKLERTLPLITERAKSVETLYEKKLASREQYLALEQERITQEQDLAAETARVQELTGEIQSVESQRAGVQSEYATKNLRALIEARQQVATLEQEYLKAQQRNSQQVLYSPIHGFVKKLEIHTIGGVVTPAQELMQIVPKDASLEVEAFIQNKDIGFVEEGQRAEVKVDTFNFTKYGTIDAELKTISSDAITDENLGLVYPATVLLNTSQIRVNDKWVELSPGMAVTVEVKTGTRRIIEYFLSPLLRYKQESIRER